MRHVESRRKWNREFKEVDEVKKYEKIRDESTGLPNDGRALEEFARNGEKA